MEQAREKAQPALAMAEDKVKEELVERVPERKPVEKKESVKMNDFQVAVLVIGIVVFIVSLFIPTGEYVKTEEYDVWITDAPFGTYWTNARGGGSILFFSTHSSLSESYTVKYMDGDEVVTVILCSTDEQVHVHLTDDNTSMKYREEYRAGHNWLGIGVDFESKLAQQIYDLWIPKPERCPEEFIESD